MTLVTLAQVAMDATQQNLQPMRERARFIGAALLSAGGVKRAAHLVDTILALGMAHMQVVPPHAPRAIDRSSGGSTIPLCTNLIC